MVLVNGGEGIGTGYSTFLPNYNVRDIVTNIKRLMNDLEPADMVSGCGQGHHQEACGMFIDGCGIMGCG